MAFFWLDLAFALSDLGRVEELRAAVQRAQRRTRWVEAADALARGELEVAAERWVELRAGHLAGGAGALEAIRRADHPLVLVTDVSSEDLAARAEALQETFLELQYPEALGDVAALVHRARGSWVLYWRRSPWWVLES